MYTLSGVIPALVTPLRGGRLDVAALEGLVERVLAAEVDAVSVLGSTGEGSLLPEATLASVVDVTVRAVHGRRPVLVGVFSAAPADALARARAYCEQGADGVMMTPPHYYKIDQRSVVDFYTFLDRELARPVVVYHFPTLTKVAIEPQTAARLASLSWIVGMKDSSGDAEFLEQVVRLTRGTPFAVFAGSGRVATKAAQVGAAGVVAASGNVAPGALVRLWRALRAGDAATAKRWQAYISAVEAACQTLPFPVNWKAALSLTSDTAPEPAFPLHELAPEQLAALGDLLARAERGIREVA